MHVSATTALLGQNPPGRVVTIVLQSRVVLSCVVWWMFRIGMKYSPVCDHHQLRPYTRVSVSHLTKLLGRYSKAFIEVMNLESQSSHYPPGVVTLASTNRDDLLTTRCLDVVCQWTCSLRSLSTKKKNLARQTTMQSAVARLRLLWCILGVQLVVGRINGASVGHRGMMVAWNGWAWRHPLP